MRTSMADMEFHNIDINKLYQRYGDTRFFGEKQTDFPKFVRENNLAEEFLEDEYADSPNFNLYKKGLENYLKWLEKNKADIPDRVLVRAFTGATKLNLAKKTQQTVDTTVDAVENFHDWLTDNGIYPDLKLAEGRRKHKEPRLSKEKTDIILEKTFMEAMPGDRFLAALILSGLYGLRLSDLAKLQCKNIEEVGKSTYLNLPERYKKPVLVEPMLAELFWDYLTMTYPYGYTPESPFFPPRGRSNGGKAVNPKYISTFVAERLEHYGIDDMVSGQIRNCIKDNYADPEAELRAVEERCYNLKPKRLRYRWK